MLDKEIGALDEFFAAPWVRTENVLVPWQHIKEALSKVDNASNNSKSKQCPDCASVMELQHVCENCGVRISAE